MPLAQAVIDKETVIQYRYHTHLTGAAPVDVLLRERKKAVHELEHWQRAQKEAGAQRDIDAARAYRSLVADAQRYLSAVRQWLGYYTGDDYRPVRHFPPSLVTELDTVARNLELELA